MLDGEAQALRQFLGFGAHELAPVVRQNGHGTGPGERFFESTRHRRALLVGQRDQDGEPRETLA